MRKLFLFACAFVSLQASLFAAPTYSRVEFGGAWRTAVNAATCSPADVKAAAAMMMAGDVLKVLGEATCKWTENWNWSPPVGAALDLGKTTIVDNYKPSTDRYHTAGPLIAITPAHAGRFRITGGTVRADKDNSNYKYALIEIYGQNKNVRVDHMHVDTTNGTYPDFSYAVVTGFQFWGHINGVIDHSEFNFPDRGGAFIVNYNQYGGHGNDGDEAWAAPTGLGTSDFIFFEDNKVNNLGSGGTINDCYRGGKWVTRYNVIVGSMAGQTHPTGGSHRGRGCRGWESYRNTLLPGPDGKPTFNAYFISSGAGVLWGNKAPAGYSNFATLHSMRFDTKTYTQAPVPDGWGQYPSNYDVAGAPLDQPGMGPGDLLTGGFPNVVNKATGCTPSQPCINPRQKREGVYEWDNEWACFQCGGNKMAVYEPAVLLPGRDYFLDTPMPGYVSYEYPHPLTVDGPAPIPPDPPQPTNEAPKITVLQIKNGSTVLDPTVPITIKNATIATAAIDDAGVTYWEITITLKNSSTMSQVLKSAVPTANPTTMTATWNTRPYTGKGEVLIEVWARDAEGLITREKRTVTVKK